MPSPTRSSQPSTMTRPETTLILHNPENVLQNPAWFNIWMQRWWRMVDGPPSADDDTFWDIHPDAGVNGEVIQNSLATGPAEYNENFSEMTVHLRDGILERRREVRVGTTSSTPSKLSRLIRK